MADQKKDASARAPLPVAQQRGPAATTDAPPPGTVIPPLKVEPKHRVEPSLVQDPLLERAQSGIEKIRENWQVVAAAILVLTVGVLFVAWRAESVRARNRVAWEELRQAMQAAEKAPAPERLEDLAGRYPGTSAEPFIRIRLGDQYFALGGKENLARAKEEYERARAGAGGNADVDFLARTSIEAAKKAASFDAQKYAELKGPKVEWAKGEKETTTTPSPTPPSAPPASTPAPSASPSK